MKDSFIFGSANRENWKTFLLDNIYSIGKIIISIILFHTPSRIHHNIFHHLITDLYEYPKW
ncbi:MAG: hypothetical protein US93_C0002G0074 [Candidatus Falkowbacteria bacterium GW2011_GWD2_38_42]|uniref:Uncharacterized protein n=1 Tax=Candidatus Falkowbacteria bacterium GW2011_GWE1_38_31 TaxID=1618638 RepID=A0A0G0JX61_9BACT|nr:MAG: hypothetical protein US73_C0001G0074 [Candidatus Falkowbacteria bacterium GW2011_GWF2_38_1205]KKQ64041.1 MAG: hypothetical protein US84_C0002G0073 [Candidatus Falkowbacteria bacterium GW2011_GWF1_38_22]KKQ66610.1 MAG: hypothetical protein US87_C0001G0131 [Candidatus Falkowbacteria bacterium GW2011_GWE2_38_254]KKQ71147.1 MAG: hypothetical protein US91_C0001G0074 [Candidatus Falkowbacteria bacterium GW2011_GWE1_38_31]KKQ73273.1 MAG: hypothetical protein US93_C0002G0074 [Candidatus Falkowb